MLRKILLGSLAIGIAFFIFCLWRREKETFIWGNLKNLGPEINSPARDEHVTLTEDGQTMFFASNRSGGMGGFDLYTSKFLSGKWTKAELMPAPVNSQRDEFDPFITLDGKMLFFASNRDNSGEYWNCEIYVSECDGKNWEQPRIYDPIFVTPNMPDWGPTFTRDMKTFIFSSARGLSSPETVQIFQSKRKGTHWSEPEKLLPPVNMGLWEATPYITPDGKELYLNSVRDDKNKKDVDIWKFEFVGGKWTNPKLMNGALLSDKHDYDPCLSSDGTKFYFSSNREGGFGNVDLYVAEKIVKKTSFSQLKNPENADRFSVHDRNPWNSIKKIRIFDLNSVMMP